MENFDFEKEKNDSQELSDDKEAVKNDDEDRSDISEKNLYTDESGEFLSNTEANDPLADTDDRKYDPFIDNEDATEIIEEEDAPVEYTEISPSTKNKKLSFTAIMSVSAFALSLVSCILLAFCLFKISSVDTNSKGNTQMGGVPSDYTQVTDENGNSLIWVNPDTIDNNDAIANAVEKTVNSSVIIEIFSKSDASDLDSPKSAGSGVLYAADSKYTYIVTCNHVIEDAANIKVTLNNGESHTATVVGTDKMTDLAVIKIAAVGLPTTVLPANDDPLLLGQTVIAIGNPLGVLGNSVTGGIVSSLERNVKIEGVTMRLLQIDASVNKGNSGGGLFDINGQLVGIVNAKSIENTVEGIGFAIPIKTVRSICAQIMQNGYVTGRPDIGISYVEINSSNYSSAFTLYPDLRNYATEKTGGFFGTTKLLPGIYVTKADKVAGYAEGSDTLKYGDRINLVAGYSISEASDIVSILASYNVGDTLEITVIREGKSVVIHLILGENKG